MSYCLFPPPPAIVLGLGFPFWVDGVGHHGINDSCVWCGGLFTGGLGCCLHVPRCLDQALPQKMVVQENFHPPLPYSWSPTSAAAQETTLALVRIASHRSRHNGSLENASAMHWQILTKTRRNVAFTSFHLTCYGVAGFVKYYFAHQELEMVLKHS